MNMNNFINIKQIYPITFIENVVLTIKIVEKTNTKLLSSVPGCDLLATHMHYFSV